MIQRGGTATSQVKSRLELHLTCLDLTWTATKPDQEVCRTAEKASVVASYVLTFTDKGDDLSTTNSIQNATKTVQGCQWAQYRAHPWQGSCRR